MNINDLNEKQIFDDWMNQSEKSIDKNDIFLETLLSYPTAKVDTIAKIADEEAFEKINCQNCANCCKQLKPDLEESDIERIATALGIPSIEFQKDFDHLTADHQCPFLGKDNLCGIYEIRPLACREFPNTQKLDFIGRIEDHKDNLNYCPATYYVVQRMQNLFEAKQAGL